MLPRVESINAKKEEGGSGIPLTRQLEPEWEPGRGRGRKQKRKQSTRTALRNATTALAIAAAHRRIAVRGFGESALAAGDRRRGTGEAFEMGGVGVEERAKKVWERERHSSQRSGPQLVDLKWAGFVLARYLCGLNYIEPAATN